MTKTILVTGGAGYIGSHTIIELLNDGYQVVVVDNLDNSSEESLKRVTKLTGKQVDFHKVDILDRVALEAVFKQYEKQPFDGCIHFAGFKAVGESVVNPLKYYRNNITGTVVLVELMQKYGCKTLVFSSSCTVYGDPEKLPVDEGCKLGANNPYGNSKQFTEKILQDFAESDKTAKIALLRYFNPVGAHPSGILGEDPIGVPNNLMPFVAQVAVGLRPQINVFGNDYNTPDGTCVRDYIHVVDLAKGHLAALKRMEEPDFKGCVAYNLGTGVGYSVLDMIKAMVKACGHDIKYEIVGRRAGDVATTYANPSKASKELKWTAAMNLEQMCQDLWKWQSGNPNGFR